MTDIQQRPVISDVELVPGLEFPPVEHMLDAEAIRRYSSLFADARAAAGLGATGSPPPPAMPTIVATFTWPSRLMTTHRLPPGSVHAGLDYEILGPIVPGRYLSRMRVTSREERKGRTWVTLAVETSGPGGTVVFRGTNSIALARPG